jgi:rhodanese-related sulfurtransferase
METITAKELMTELGKHCMNIVNVLDAESFKDCHILDSVNIPLNDIEKNMKDWDRNAKIIVYCASVHCHASRRAYEILKKMYFKTIFAYEGGMKEWHELKYPCEGACKMPYLSEK